MKVLTSLMSGLMAMAAASLLFSSCSKDKCPPTGDSKLCPIERLELTTSNGANYQVNMTYDYSGNLLSMVPSGQFPQAQFLYFRYDSRNRLTDYQVAFSDSNAPVTWHRYSYPQKDVVIDSFFVNGDAPRNAPHPFPGSFQSASTIHMDAKGRINNGSGYDANGDLKIPDVVYDNKANPMQANNTFMFINQNYSAHNPLTWHATPLYTYKYNAAGAPTDITATALAQAANVNVQFFYFYQYTTMHIVYACDGLAVKSPR